MKRFINKLFGGLRLWQKFALLGVIATLLTALPFYLFFSSEQQRIDTVLREQAALQPAAKLLDALQALQKHRDLSSNLLDSKSMSEGFGRRKQKTAVDTALADFNTTVKSLNYSGLAAEQKRLEEDWRVLAEGVKAQKLTAEQSFDAHTRLIDATLATLRSVLAVSGLDREANPASHYLVQALLANAPTLTERLGVARAYGTRILAKSETVRGIDEAETAPGTALTKVAKQDRVQIFGLVDRAQERLNETNYQFIQLRLADAALQERLAKSLQSANALAEDALKVTQNEIVAADTVSFPINEFQVRYTRAIDAVFALLATGSAELDAQFGRELAQARKTQLTLSAIVGAVFAAGILLAVVISNSITAPIRHLVNVTNALADGDSSVRANMQSNDEIGVLGRQFDIMVAQREAVSARIRDENEHLNNSVIELLQTVARLAQRDLTVKASVAEDITGPVSDALNLLSDETAKVLQRVTRIAADVADVSRQVKSQADTVLQVASAEKYEAEQAALELGEASSVMLDIADLALTCNSAAEKAINTTDRAQQTVLGTVQGIGTIRDTIRETEKRIKRLGERSQEIGGVVNLINGIAERTHILALNAAMHAASAGEAGRGFAVVANEVQRLAENAREATAKIAALVSNIQTETADTVVTMNDAISQVVHGADLAQQAGEEMRATRDTTADLVQLVQRIAANSSTQAQTAQRLLERAVQIQRSSEETFVQLQDQGRQTERLVDFAGGLVESVGVFILPKNEPALAA